MAKAKTALKVIYHAYINDDVNGEADAFFTINKEKLTFLTGWFHNDAMWRGEYMSDLLTHAGADIKNLPQKYQSQAGRLMAKAYGLE